MKDLKHRLGPRRNAESEKTRFQHRMVAFTLVELLVVIAIIALLMSILVPVLSRTREQARRVACMGNIRQFLIGIQVYADDYDGNLPLGLSDFKEPEDEHTPILSRAVRNALVEIIGDERCLSCPWLRKPFDVPGGWYYTDYGYVLGYNYLGGHKGTPWPKMNPANAEWKSPQQSVDRPSTPVVTELNAWSTDEMMTFAPHGARGAILEAGDSGNQSFDGATSEQIGAVGGHVGYLDGSVSWKRIGDMKIYRGSRRWDDAGCYTTW